MKIMSATLVSLALMIGPAPAEDAYQSTMSGNVTIEVVPKDTTKGETRPKPAETLTIRFVPPPKPVDVDEDDIQQKLKLCGDKWNKKLDDYEAHLPKLQKYLAYYKKWEDHPAQRPPKSPEPLLTRASYRACMYACLGGRRVACPGGWPANEEKK